MTSPLDAVIVAFAFLAFVMLVPEQDNPSLTDGWDWTSGLNSWRVIDRVDHIVLQCSHDGNMTSYKVYEDTTYEDCLAIPLEDHEILAAFMSHGDLQRQHVSLAASIITAEAHRQTMCAEAQSAMS